MDIGVVSRSFPKFTNEEAALFMAGHGFRWTELCFFHKRIPIIGDTMDAAT